MRNPQIRCYQCQGIFTTVLPGALHHVRCPYCSTINGIPAQNPVADPVAAVNTTVAGAGDLSSAAMQRQEQLLRRLQQREITPLELLILREFVEHLQQGSRTGATSQDINNMTASWVVDDVGKLPEELHSCSVCLEDICVGDRVRTLPCLHTFHCGCAEEWLKKKKVCPLCQFPIDGQQDGEDAGLGVPELTAPRAAAS